MPKTTPVPEETRQAIVQMKSDHPERSARNIADRFRLHHKTVSKILKNDLIGLVEEVSQPQLAETSEVKGDKWTITLPKTRIHSLEELVKQFDIDLSLWEVERFVANSWEVGIRVGEGDKARIQTEPLYQVKAFLKKRVEVEDARNEVEELKKLAKEHTWPISIVEQQVRKSSGLMLEVNIPDLHAGKLAWSPETGGPNYDVKIAEATYWRALNTLLSRVSGYAFDQVLFVIGNDALNSDDVEGRTTAGTYVSSDARFHKTFAVVRTMIIRAVERLKQIAPVRIIPVYGNHDRLSAWHLADSVEMYFSHDSEVSMDNRPRTRKYHQHGKVMLMFCHGDKGKKDDYPLTMATEEPVMFGSTIYRECHTGHTHKTKLDEQHGVRVRVLPALCPADDWHSQSFFVGNKRSAEAYIWDKEEGLLSVVYHTEPD